jgi:Tfp pilus assembly protein PilN
MRPVNLLPAKNRPHQPSGSKSGSSYLVLGILGLLLAGVVAYVMQSNTITQANSDIAVAQQKTAEARARTQQLAPFGNFAEVKTQRVQSVKDLATSRLDWERSMREIAHVLPVGVWLQDFNASVSGTDSADGSASTSGTTPTSGPSIRIHGCAFKQPEVATTLVRLRAMAGVTDVTLSDSTRGQDDKQSSSASSDGQSANTTGCGSHNGRANYDFNVTVEFEAAQAAAAPSDKPTKTPVRLGGGS